MGTRLGDKPLKMAEEREDMIVSELSGVVRTTGGLVKATRWALSGLHERRQTSRDAMEMRRLIGVEDRNLDYRAGVLHPLSLPGTIGPDDSAALTTLAGPAYQSARVSGRLQIVDSIDVCLDQGQVLIGSPEAEAVTRLAYGYRRRGDGLGMVQSAHPPIDLPYRWEEDETRVAARSSRYVPGRGLRTRPNWPVIDATGGGRLLFPEVDRDNLMTSDYLLITRTPNFLTETAYQSARSLVSIAGSHGPGTRAIEVLLRDKKALALLRRTLPRKHFASFQVLVRADRIEHDYRMGSRARAIEVCDIQVLHHLTHAALKEATCRVQRDLSRWREEIGVGCVDARR